MGRSAHVNSSSVDVKFPQLNTQPHLVNKYCSAQVYALRDLEENSDMPCQVLPTLLVPISAGDDIIKVRALLDTGSTSSFVTVSALSSIPYETLDSEVPLIIRTLQGETREVTQKVRISLKTQTSTLPVTCYVVPSITEIFRIKCLSRKERNSIQQTVLNEPLTQRAGKVNLLLGTPVLWKVVCKIHTRINSSLVLLDTIFGAVLCGASNNVAESDKIVDYDSFHAITAEELNKRFEKIWQLEAFPRDDSEAKLSMDEIAAVESIEKNLKFLKEKKRFETRLLWRGKPDLKNNYASAKIRLDGLMRRLCTDPNLKDAYK